QAKMLASLLDKLIRKIKINRLLKEESLSRRLIIDLSRVLEEICEYFKNQFRSRNFQE
ncbi:8480_t:CDS:1, partial [Racocetra persica]